MPSKKIDAKTTDTPTIYTDEQKARWFNEMGKLAGKARTKFKQFEEKQEKLAAGVDKDALQAKVIELASQGKMAEMMPIARELENADTLVQTWQERSDEYERDYNLAMTMLEIIVQNAKFERVTDFDPDKYMLSNFLSEELADSAAKAMKTAQGSQSQTIDVPNDGLVDQDAIIVSKEMTDE